MRVESEGMMMKSHLKQGSALAFALVACAGGSAAQAQEAPAASEAPAEPEIIVTAARREQSLQNVPIAVTAVSSEQLVRANITSTADLLRVVPTMQITTTNSETGGSTIRIRGVGTAGNNVGLEGAVGVFIDGVYRQRSGLAMNNMFDIDRIEVLRGPQGTLFGKNTSAGAITITPKTPRIGVFDAMVKAGVGNYDNRELEGMINIPVADNLALRVSGAFQRRDGFIKDVGTGERSQSLDRMLYRGMLLWEPTDRISWRVTADYSEKNEECCAAVYRIVGAATVLQTSLVPGAVVPLGQRDRSISTPGRPYADNTKDFGVSSHLAIKLGDDITFKTILAHREFDGFNSVDADFGAADILYQSSDVDQELNSFEATLNGNWGRLDWLVGGYYSDESIDYRQATTYGADVKRFVTALTGGAISPATAAALYPTGGGNTGSVFSQDSEGYSFFTHNQFQFTDRFGAFVGVRYNHEKKNGGLASYTTNSPSCGGGPFNGQGAAAPAGLPGALRLLCPRPTTHSVIDESEVTGTAGLNFKLTDDIMAYVSYSHGYKAGGINLDRDAAASVLGINPGSGLVVGTQAQVNEAVKFKPELSDSYELGIRSQFFDRALTVNATYFHTDYDDFQLNNFNGIAFSIVNAGTVKSRGFEVEGSWRAAEGLSFTYGVSHVIARWGNEPVLQFDPPDNAAPLPPNLPLAGRILNNAPKWSISSGVHYEHGLGDKLRGFVDLGASYRSSIIAGANLNAAKAEGDLLLLNGRIGLVRDGDNGWEIALWGTNLTNRYYAIVAFDSLFQNGSISEFPGVPRTYGLSVRKNF